MKTAKELGYKGHGIYMEMDKCRFWKGGRRENNGYFILYIPDDHKYVSMRNSTKYVLEHRIVMANHLGRPLLTNELVHHKDGNRGNNNIKNLELTTRNQHTLDHSKGYQDGFKKGYLDGLKEIKNERINNNSNKISRS